MSRIDQALEKAATLRKMPGTSIVKTNDPVQAIRQHTRPPLVDCADLTRKVENSVLVTLCDPHSLVSEEYRKLKSYVTAYARHDDFKNVIMVTSSVSGEGKSVTSLNLAVTLAQELDHTVLLVDADMRKTVAFGISRYEAGEGAVGLS
jgi:protein-tyrosine kinase